MAGVSKANDSSVVAFQPDTITGKTGKKAPSTVPDFSRMKLKGDAAKLGQDMSNMYKSLYAEYQTAKTNGDAGEQKRLTKSLGRLRGQMNQLATDFGNGQVNAGKLNKARTGFENSTVALEEMIDSTTGILRSLSTQRTTGLERPQAGGVGLRRQPRADNATGQAQGMLQDLGYDVGKFGADGRLGKDTKAAIKEFQSHHGLEQTGRLDPGTLNSLREAIKNGDTSDKHVS